MNINLNEPKYFSIKCKNILPTLSYELYLLELINQSKFFLTKSEGEKYKAPPSESKSENDAISCKYEFDFKLLIYEDYMYLKNKNKPNVDYSHINDGIILVNTKKEEIVDNFPNILYILYKCDFSNLTDDYKAKLKGILNNAEKDKNIMWFYPYKFSFSEKNDRSVVFIARLLNVALSNFLSYRSSCQPNRDTYICVKNHNLFLFYVWKERELQFIDMVPSFMSPTYREIEYLSLY